MKVSQYKDRASRHVIVYGAPKTGKTELVGTLLKKYRLHWLCLDGGVKTLLSDSSSAKPYLENLEIYPIPDSQRFPVAVQTLLKVFKGGDCAICHTHGIVGCASPGCKAEGMFTTLNVDKLDVKKDIVVVDHMSQLMDSVNNWNHKEALAKDDFDGLKSDFSDYLKYGAMSDRFGSTWQSAPYNVIVISHEVSAPMENGTKKITPVGGTRNQSSDFARYFDDAVYTEIIGGQYKAQVSAGDKSQVVIGSRTGKVLKPAKVGERVSLLELFE